MFQVKKRNQKKRDKSRKPGGYFFLWGSVSYFLQLHVENPGRIKLAAVFFQSNISNQEMFD